MLNFETCLLTLFAFFGGWILSELLRPFQWNIFGRNDKFQTLPRDGSYLTGQNPQAETTVCEETLVQYELKFLRCLIHPHFLSNSLTGLQNLILENEREKAINYIADFGKYMHLLVEHTQQDFIDLNSEMEALRKFIDLENYGRTHPVKYKIEVIPHPRALSEDMYMLPALMIQPLVENSILHGFDDRLVRENNLLVKFTFGDQLEVLICDNGKGMPVNQPVKKGITSSIERRLNLYGQKFSQNFKLSYQPGEPSGLYSRGSCVQLILPYYLTRQNEEKKLYLRKNQSYSYR